MIARDLEQLWNVKFNMPSVSRAGITNKLNEMWMLIIRVLREN